MKVFVVTILAISILGCTDATISRIGAFGDSAHVQCFSGEKLIYDGRSTGRVSNSENSDGYYFRDASDGVLREVSGNCIVSYGEVK